MRPIRTGRRLFRRWLTLWLEDRRRGRAAAHLVNGPTVPIAPANLSASDFGNYIGLDWEDMSQDEFGFRIYRKDGAGAYGLNQALPADTLTTQDLAVVIGHTYSYYVVAVNGQGESAPSNVAVITFGGAQP